MKEIIFIPSDRFLFYKEQRMLSKNHLFLWHMFGLFGRYLLIFNPAHKIFDILKSDQKSIPEFILNLVIMSMGLYWSFDYFYLNREKPYMYKKLLPMNNIEFFSMLLDMNFFFSIGILGGIVIRNQDISVYSLIYEISFVLIWILNKGFYLFSINKKQTIKPDKIGDIYKKMINRLNEKEINDLTKMLYENQNNYKANFFELIKIVWYGIILALLWQIIQEIVGRLFLP
ncbi:hypothetical protein [Herpetosiphon llansteffanensis]|uniref:hypothetical protein n=1 Tax=Herpetosiphon llansteffanensis TaxID=2094568 RepID=UPI000F519F33|nr:hypothetical protein [Herpetosiphon llansteffanensis]